MTIFAIKGITFPFQRRRRISTKLSQNSILLKIPKSTQNATEKASTANGKLYIKLADHFFDISFYFFFEVNYLRLKNFYKYLHGNMLSCSYNHKGNVIKLWFARLKFLYICEEPFL